MLLCYEILYAVLNLDSILFDEIFHAILYHEVVVNDGSLYLILLCSCIYTLSEDLLSEDNVEIYFRNELYLNYNFALVLQGEDVLSEDNGELAFGK